MNFHHLALTGPPEIGKTTYVKKLIDSLTRQGIMCYGFITEEVRDKGRRIGFDVVTLDGKRGLLSRNNGPGPLPTVGGKTRRQNCVGQYVVDVESFENLVLPLLSEEIPKNAVLILDEIGKMEMFSVKFVKKVRELITSSKNLMIMTVPVPKGRPVALVDEIRNHKQFNIQTLTTANRNEQSTYEEILKFLTKDLILENW